jgi:hypothetical protein
VLTLAARGSYLPETVIVIIRQIVIIGQLTTVNISRIINR